MKSSEVTAVYVLGGIGIAAAIGYYIINKKLNPVGGLTGATDAASGVSQIASGVQQLAAPFRKLWADFMTPSGAGSAVDPNDPKKSGSPAFFAANNYGVPSWLMTTNSAVNTANGAIPLIQSIVNVTR